jgi:protease-4
VAEHSEAPSVWGFIKGFGKLIVGFLLVIQGVLGLIVMLMIVGLLIAVSNGIGGAKSPTHNVPDGAALLINPNGVLVEQAMPVDPVEMAFKSAYGIDEPGAIEVGEVIRAIRAAAKDDRIKGIVLDLGDLQISPIYASKVHDIGAALEAFKTSGKKVYAIGDFYGQEQYALAAHADEIYMHDKGSVVLIGYGAYDVYLKSFLEKIKVTPHVFRVGTFKAAVEPFLRDDMSPEAKEANLAFLGSMWSAYSANAEKARGLPAGAINDFSNNFGEIIRAVDGDFAKAALSRKLVDHLKSRPEQMDAMKALFGQQDDDEETFKSVELSTYLGAIGAPKDGEAPNVGIVTAAGAIVDGEAPIGEAAGGDTVAMFLKQALDDEDVKAVVLRVDSPGGSAFASEVIRDGVIALQKAGKPVVVSMGSLAASGGYWISAPADEIWASPTTVTGSIGIFAFFPTFENAAAHWGVNVDGVGTTSISSIYGAGLGPLEPNVADIFQQSVEHGYREFLSVVAEGRKLEPAYVDSVGQGRVWIGSKAKDLKLVDKIGDIDDAAAAAARLAKLEAYDAVEIVDSKTSFELFMEDFAGASIRLLGLDHAAPKRTPSIVSKVAREIGQETRFLDEFNDPNALYARCMACGE